MASPRRNTADRASGDEASRRIEIVRAAAKLFREKGFDGTTVRDIAGAVGMQSGSPFYYFESKHDILLAVMEQGLRDGLERTEAAVNPSQTPPERFRALVRTHFGILHDIGSEFITVMLYDWRSLPDEHRRKLVTLKDRYDAVWQRTLEDLHVMGRLDIDPKLARLMILGAINFTATWYRPEAKGRGALNLDRIADETARFYLREPSGEPHPAQAALRDVRKGLESVRTELAGAGASRAAAVGPSTGSERTGPA